MNPKPILTMLAAVLVISSLKAEDQPAGPTPAGKTESRSTTTPSKVEQQNQKKLKRAHHLAEKSANTEFLKSPHGIAFKEQLVALDQEINAVYEKHLNIFRQDPASEKGTMLREERDRQLQALFQKQKKIEAGYESLKKTSPDYRAMVEKHLKSELSQLKGKLKSQSTDDEDDDK